MKVKLKNVNSPTQYEVTIGLIELYFSYETCVGFYAPGEGTVVSENVWSTTTGKHLNYWQSDKTKRVKHDEFQTRLEAVLAKIDIKH
jgi:hypothetical protein